MALAISVITVVTGGAAREIGAVPWVVLVVLLGVDLAMSLRRPKNLTFEAPAEVFVGETARLELDIARAPQGLQGKIDWPDGLGGDADFAFFPAAASDVYKRQGQKSASFPTSGWCNPGRSPPLCCRRFTA